MGSCRPDDSRAASPELRAQSLEQRIYATKAEVVRMSFAARPGVCGSGPNSINVRSSTEEWDSGCEAGPCALR